ncbi:MAG: indolepyruvate ferredoxin oxidoreductase subunit alpha [Candidatus Diapherotrites archaeon]|nr:indolepyruvate ferredoxin oxidoreductase subunit alpha [Candidatus Diapherotrites archaeon]
MDVLEKAGRKVVLLGNEAIARGAIESGVGVFAAYPGTPSSEVPITLSRIAKKVGIKFEYSSNEKVAFETAAGAAWSGVRAMTAMKHFGLNVASDSVLPVAYVGVKAGLVIMVADDPQGWSSAQSEQDTRYYARMARMPMLEPSNPQEALDFTKIAFEISEAFEIPVFLRTTTKVSHSIGTVRLGKIEKPKTRGRFVKDLGRYYNIRPNLQEMHKRIDKKLMKIEKRYGRRLTKVLKGKGRVGIITNGVSFEYVKEIVHELKINPHIMKLGMTHPLPKKEIESFIRDKKVVLIVEELEPIIENFVVRVAKDVNPKLVIHGKDVLPRYGEYNVEVLMPAFGKVFGKKVPDFRKHRKDVEKVLRGLAPRKPVMCPGCPHRSTFYAVKKVFGDKAIYAGDIGCYVLGIFEPFEMQDFVISMGASLGISHGIKKVSNQEVVAFVGDSTFFHAGMPGIANLRFNDGNAPLVIVMDNGITAMTGHQPHPGSGFTGMGEPVTPIKIEEVAKALGAEVRVANAFNQKDLIERLKELKERKGLRVLVSRGECRLLTKRKLRAKDVRFVTFEIDQEKCMKCSECTDHFSCPAIMEVREKPNEEAKYVIDPDLCWGCSVCMQICPYNAIRPRRKK